MVKRLFIFLGTSLFSLTLFGSSLSVLAAPYGAGVYGAGDYGAQSTPTANVAVTPSPVATCAPLAATPLPSAQATSPPTPKAAAPTASSTPAPTANTPLPSPTPTASPTPSSPSPTPQAAGIVSDDDSGSSGFRMTRFIQKNSSYLESFILLLLATWLLILIRLRHKPHYTP